MKNHLFVQAVKSFLNAARINRHGNSVKEKLVIIESDDWGAIRMPSADALNQYKEGGYSLQDSVYKYDALASGEDLDFLFNLLDGVKGSDGKPSKITMNAIMANPDFEKIRESDFQEYHYESFLDTLQHYPKHSGNLAIWKSAMEQGVAQTQFHGREHLNIKRWMRNLQKNHIGTRFSFDLGSTYSGNGDYSYMEAYDWDNPGDVWEHQEIIREGLVMFRSIFGFSSYSFIAPCYNWDSQLEEMLANEGIQWIQGMKSQLQPTGKFEHYTRMRHNFGSANEFGSKYNIRNCMFEPSSAPERDWVNSCLAQISSAFLFNRPAVICAHRVNFVGFINENNRDNGLYSLEKLLRSILKKWPEVRFISTDELNEYLPSTH